jgi:hypothetical protein
MPAHGQGTGVTELIRTEGNTEARPGQCKEERQGKMPKECIHCHDIGMMKLTMTDRSTELRPCRYCEAGMQRRTPKPCSHCQGTGLMQLVKTDRTTEPYPCLYCDEGARVEAATYGVEISSEEWNAWE